MSVLLVRHAGHRRSAPYTISSGPRCRSQLRPKGSSRTGVIHHRVPRPQGSSLHCCDSADERTRCSLCGNNCKGLALLNYDQFPEQPHQYVTTPRPSSDPSHQLTSIAMTGSLKLAHRATLLLGRPSRVRELETSAHRDFTAWQIFFRAVLHLQTWRGLTACER